MLSLFNKITKNSYLFPSRTLESEAARQGPAFGVIPVFIPLHPSPSKRLVFSQVKVYSFTSFLIFSGEVFYFYSSIKGREVLVLH
jgi:hypothetical protein